MITSPKNGHCVVFSGLVFCYVRLAEKGKWGMGSNRGEYKYLVVVLSRFSVQLIKGNYIKTSSEFSFQKPLSCQALEITIYV